MLRTPSTPLALTFALLALGTLPAQCSSSKTAAAAPQSKDIVQTAVAAGSFKTLATALQTAGLIETLSGPGPFTVFAPTDTAFARLPEGTVESLLRPESRGQLTRILTYHVASGKLDAAHVLGMTEIPTLAGEHLTVRTKGSSAFVSGSMITRTDIQCSNGVIHVIDTVMLPPAPATAVAAPAADPQPASIIQTAVAAESFSTLVAAVKAAGLVEALSGPGPFTVFAPTDAAFARLPEGVLSSLLEHENKELLQTILTYHVVSGRIESSSVTGNSSATTLNGQDLRFAVDGKGVTVNGSRVVAADISCTNGIIHVVDSVILPPQKETSSTGRFPEVAGKNLEDVEYALPGDFGSEVNLVLIAFQRWQQQHIDQWLPVADRLGDSFPELSYYELPVLGEGWKLLRGWIDGGMAKGIPDAAARARTITLYIDKGPFLSSLGIDDENQVYAMLVDRHGCVLWQHTGTPDQDSVRSLTSFLSSALPRGASSAQAAR